MTPRPSSRGNVRNRVFFSTDLAVFVLAPLIAVTLRFEAFRWPAGMAETLLGFVALTLPVRVGITWWTGMYRCMWQHASILELERILLAGLLSGVATFTIGLGLAEPLGLAPMRMPVSTLVLDSFLTLAGLALPRLAVRYLQVRRRHHGTSARRTIIVGAGTSGLMMAREAMTSRAADFQVVAFVDDDRAKLGRLLNGIRVAGTIEELPRLVRELGASDVIIAMPSARGGVVRRVVELAQVAGARASTVPSLADIASGRVEMTALRPVEIQDLLRRAPVSTDRASVKALVEGRTVLVTGAGGSIGSELCRQIAELGPELLILLDHAENPIFEIEGALRRRHPGLKLAPIIADIRDEGRVQQVFERFRPFAVFHAAAHKHVPLMEENVVEVITNNVHGTRNVAQTAADCGVTHFVLISTDKAVRPTSVMGASKQLAEQVVRRIAAREGRHFVAVRFGNVLGSSGSVVPTFLGQIERGGPVTVTHPEMRRFFMTIPEAVQLVLQAGAFGRGGEVFVLDMGEPVRIADLARDLIRLSGLEEGEDIEIKYTGIRPGEKLFEELTFGHEEVRETDHPKILRILADEPSADLDARVSDLIRRAKLTPEEEGTLRAALVQLVSDFQTPAADNVLPLRRPAQEVRPA